MLNSKPIAKGKYDQGLYVPKNKNKVIKLNNLGGLYYRSGLEKKMMIYLDNNGQIKNWGAEHITIYYTLKSYNAKLNETTETEHRYFPDFYYELIRSDGSVVKVIAEVKPVSDTRPPVAPSNPTPKKLKNYEYSLKMWNKNLTKWKYAIEYCKMKGFEFVIITDEQLNKSFKK